MTKNDIRMHYEKLWLDNCPPEFKLVIYRWYVDDMFVLFKSKDRLLLFTKYMNGRHKNLKFTFNFGQNNSLSFLDANITRGNKGFSTRVFRKATFSGVFANFDSFILESYNKIRSNIVQYILKRSTLNNEIISSTLPMIILYRQLLITLTICY